MKDAMAKVRSAPQTPQGRLRSDPARPAFADDACGAIEAE